MRRTKIGTDADNLPIFLSAEKRRQTHMHIIGGSGTGKSKFLESLIRSDIREGQGLCLVDWHGTLFDDVLRYCAQLDVGIGSDFRRLILLNPSRPDYIIGFNPFMNQGADISTQVSRRIDATIRPWGITDTNVMPTFERICRLIYTFAVEQRETLPNAAQLLQFDKTDLRRFAMQRISDPYVKQQWQQLLEIKNFRDWREFVLSTENRLARFLSSTTIKRFMGLADGNINVLDEMNQGSIILVNLGPSGYLDREAARVFASLLLNEFFESTMLRATSTPRWPKPFTLYLDEFQEYITGDISSMLDQVRKGGLHMVLAHQHLGHLTDNPKLLHSILTNARIRAVFGGLSYEDGCLLGNEMFLPDLNQRQIKAAYYHTVTLHEEQTRTIRSNSSGRGSSRTTSQSESEAFSTQNGRGRAFGTSAGRSYGSSFSAGSLSSAAIGVSMPELPAAVGESESRFTESNGLSRSSSDTASDCVSACWSESEFEGFSESRSNSLTRGGSENISESQTEGESVVPVWVPIPVQELTTETDWAREEKLSKVAETIKTQQQRRCFIKIDTEETQPLLVPYIQDYPISEESLAEYEREVHAQQHALDAATVDRLLKASEERFLGAASSKEPGDNDHERLDKDNHQTYHPQRAREALFATIKEPALPMIS